MTDIGVPYQHQPCSHPAPVFGCLSCIQRQKDAWGKAKYDEWRKTYKPETCKECGSQMQPYEWNVTAQGVKVTLLCLGGQGEYECSELEVPIPC